MATHKEKSNKDLLKSLNEKREMLRQFRFGISGSKTRDVKVGKNTRKEVARILTELNTRTLEK